MKKTFILLAALCIVSACDTKEAPGKGPKLGLDPIHLDFENKRDTAIVTSKIPYIWVGGIPISENGYKSYSEDTLDDGWIKIITLGELKQVKVIVDDNNTSSGRYYYASITSGNSGEIITIFQSYY